MKLGNLHVFLNARVLLGENVTQNLLHIEHLCQTRVFRIAIQACNAGDQTTAMPLGREHMLPLQAHDLVHFFHGKRLGGAGKLRDEQDAQPLGGVAAGDGRQIDHRNHFAAHIGNAHHRGRRIDHDGNLGHHHDLAHLEDVDAEQLTPVRALCLAQAKQEQLEHAVAG
jgi:hypothetical protein